MHYFVLLSLRYCGTRVRVPTQRRKLDHSFRNDSLSSDQSEHATHTARPPPPRPYKHKMNPGHHQNSVSSSDEEIRSTPDCTSCGEDFESESISEKEYGYRGMLPRDGHYDSKTGMSYFMQEEANHCNLFEFYKK